jgi:four helix bundle protein
MDRAKYDLEQRLMEYAARVIKVVEALPATRVGNHIADQLLRSGTSPYPNHGEAQAAESKKDFVHKIKICLKELREAYRWLKLIKYVKLINRSERLDDLIDETEQLIRIFTASIKTAKGRG